MYLCLVHVYDGIKKFKKQMFPSKKIFPVRVKLRSAKPCRNQTSPRSGLASASGCYNNNAATPRSMTDVDHKRRLLPERTMDGAHILSKPTRYCAIQVSVTHAILGINKYANIAKPMII